MPFRRDRFREIREKFGTREKLAEKIKMTSTTIANWETTDRTPDISDLDRAAIAMSTTVAYLNGEIDDPSLDALKNAAPKNYRLRSGSGEIADPGVMKLLQQKLEVLNQMIDETEKQIRSNSGSGDKDTAGN